MTLDEAIKHAEEVAEEQDKAAKEWHENQVRKCEHITFTEMDYTHENECKERAEEHRQLAEWLKELKWLIEQTRWIPVSERLPKEGQKVLCQCQAGIIDVLTWSKSVGWIENDTNAYMPLFVIAWMPLHKPYKAESEDNE